MKKRRDNEMIDPEVFEKEELNLDNESSNSSQEPKDFYIESKNRSDSLSVQNGNDSKKKLIFIGTGILLLILIGIGILYITVLNKNTNEVAVPVYSQPGGEYDSPQSVEIKAGGEDQVIYYTTDGSDPSINSTRYMTGEKININKDTILKSIAVDQKGNTSEIAQEFFIINDKNSGTNAPSSTDSSKNDGITLSKPFDLTANTIDDWTFYDQNMLDLFSVSATSSLGNDGSITYDPVNVLDNNPNTAWIEGISGDGKGEKITLTYEGTTPYTFYAFFFMNGYTKSSEIFHSNSTPTVLEVYENNNNLGIVRLKATPDPQYVPLPDPITLKKGDSITFAIKNAATGMNDDTIDTAISEIRLE